LPKVLSTAQKELLAQNRLLIASPFAYGKPSRPDRASCLARNEWVRARAVSCWESSSREMPIRYEASL